MIEFKTISLENGRLVEETTLNIDLSKVPSSDPLAFAYGMSRGQASIKAKAKDEYFVVKHGSNHRDLAQEYLRGFLLGYKGILVPEGTKIKKGEEQCYTLFNKNILK